MGSLVQELVFLQIINLVPVVNFFLLSLPVILAKLTPAETIIITQNYNIPYKVCLLHEGLVTVTALIICLLV